MGGTFVSVLYACQAASLSLPGAAGLGLSSGACVGLVPAVPQLGGVRFRTLPGYYTWKPSLEPGNCWYF